VREVKEVFPILPKRERNLGAAELAEHLSRVLKEEQARRTLQEKKTPQGK
jgi:hypothetical protein